ncbi:MAG TPA: histidine--tRNA ligase [Planctomycetes bacterium]|nr:histidine--tRNA ligase [Planctomycetota bacterium]
MASASFHAPRGTRDLLPENLLRTLLMEEAAREVARRGGYGEIRPPLFEETKLFSRSLGNQSDVVEKEMFTVLRRGEASEDSWTFRPEGTAGVVRAYIEAGCPASAPFQKWFYMGPMFRYERPQKGRERQFQQFGVEVFGSKSPLLDAEIVDGAMQFFEALGFGPELEARVNTMGDESDRAEWRQSLLSYFEPHLDARCEDCRSRFKRNVFRLLDCKNDACISGNQGAPALTTVMGKEASEHHTAFLMGLERLGRKPKIDGSLVRGLDYYSRTVFEIHYPPLGARSALCGGGRYDGLVELLGGPPTPAIGFAAGFTSTELAMEEMGLPANADVIAAQAAFAPAVYCLAIGEEDREAAFAAAHECRSAGLSTAIDYRNRSAKAQFKEANRLSVPFVFVIGPDEREQGVVLLRDMVNGEEEKIPLDEAVSRLAAEL